MKQVDGAKAAKKAWKKGLRKAGRPWGILAFLSAFVAVVCGVALLLVGVMENSFVILAGSTYTKYENYDEDAMYYSVGFESDEERIAYERDLVEQIEGEGATLLMNENGALPLDMGAKVSCFSSSSVNLIYGGTGSGAVDTEKAPDLKDALEDAGFSVNETLWEFYSEGEGSEYVRRNSSMFANTNAATGEVPWDEYTDEELSSVKEYGDAAIVVISRLGGEGADLEFQDLNYLALDDNEKAMLSNLAKMKEEGTIGRIIVLLNSSNAIQLDFLKDEVYGVDAALWIGGVGVTGINAVADILAGDVVPSGHLPDTFCYDNYSSPAMVNMATQVYDGAEGAGLGNNQKYYVVYQEGIYVGYRYYETRYEDYVMGTGNAGAYAYGDDVAYPFGFGLSYTEFEYSDASFRYNVQTDQFEVTVTVKNVGDHYSGKETVQVYSQSPYTDYDKENQVEKAAVTLCGFEKTDILAPGESQEVTVFVDKRDMASYDAYGEGTYILDDGDYYLVIGKNAHDAVNNVLAAKGFTAGSSGGRMDENGRADLALLWTQEEFDADTYAMSKNGTEIVNQFEGADLNLYGDSPAKVTYLSRSDWSGTYPAEPVKLGLTDGLVADLALQRHENVKSDASELPTFGAKNGLKLYDMMGLDFDDPKWEDLLDQLTWDEMVNTVSESFHLVRGAGSVQAPTARQENGPQGFTGFFGRGAKDAMAITSVDILAATYNKELAGRVGDCIGQDCLNAGVSALYGPGNNTHRTPYAGRNFEYYSEDGFLAGALAAEQNAAITENGVLVEMKHFALNDCEENRMGLGTWANEQSIREIYLKAFQPVVERIPSAGVMNGYDRFGAVWCGAHENLLKNVLRGEWGCTGFIITDNATVDYMSGVDGVLAGSALFDAMMTNAEKHLRAAEGDAEVAYALREAMHYNLYNMANSSAMNGIGPDTVVKACTPGLIVKLRIGAGVFAVLFAACLARRILKRKKYKGENPKPW